VQIGIGDAEPIARPPFYLEPIHPNPFAAPYEIAYSLPEAGRVRLAVYDVQGWVRAILAEGVRIPGRHVVHWDPRSPSGSQLERGVYFVRLAVGDRIETQKLILATLTRPASQATELTSFWDAPPPRATCLQGHRRWRASAVLHSGFRGAGTGGRCSPRQGHLLEKAPPAKYTSVRPFPTPQAAT
jgi:hypothetical protein